MQHVRSGAYGIREPHPDTDQSVGLAHAPRFEAEHPSPRLGFDIGGREAEARRSYRVDLQDHRGDVSLDPIEEVVQPPDPLESTGHGARCILRDPHFGVKELDLDRLGSAGQVAEEVGLHLVEFEPERRDPLVQGGAEAVHDLVDRGVAPSQRFE